MFNVACAGLTTVQWLKPAPAEPLKRLSGHRPELRTPARRGQAPRPLGRLPRRRRRSARHSLATACSLPRTAGSPLTDRSRKNNPARRLSACRAGGKYTEQYYTKVGSRQPRSYGAPGWVTRWLGMNPPDSHVVLHERASIEISGACGVPPSLFSPQGEGTGQRESYCRLRHSTIALLGKISSDELSEKLESPDGRSAKVASATPAPPRTPVSTPPPPRARAAESAPLPE